MISRIDKSVKRVVSAAQRTVGKHISVSIVDNVLSVEYNEPIVSIILERAVLCTRDISCRVIAECLRGNNAIVNKTLYSSARHSAQVIISIAHFGRICKCL